MLKHIVVGRERVPFLNERQIPRTLSYNIRNVPHETKKQRDMSLTTNLLKINFPAVNKEKKK